MLLSTLWSVCVRNSTYLQLSQLPSSEEDSSLAQLPPHDLDRLQHLSGDVSRLVILQSLWVEMAVGAPAAGQQDVVADGEGTEGLAGGETRACDADCLENASRPQLLQYVVGGQAAGLGLWVGLDAPVFPGGMGCVGKQGMSPRTVGSLSY